MTARKLLPIVTPILLGALLIWTLFFWQPATHIQEPATEPAIGGNFTLQSASGPFSLVDLRGKVVLLYFGYTSCPDICPTSLTLMRIALSHLSETELAQVHGIFISVDPQRDTPQRLAEYSQHFHPNISGITGTPEQIAEVAGRYGAVYQRSEGDSAMGYTVDHSSVTYLIDQQGKLRKALPHGTAPKLIVKEVRHLLANR